MKALVAVAVALVAAGGLSLALGRNAPDRPPGIAADRWAPISETLGFVLVPDSSAADPLPGTMGASAGQPKLVVGAVDPTGLFAAPNAAMEAIIEEGHPVRGYIMVKRGKLWRPLTVVAPTVND